jgi:sugar (pentulose or hexulose) kinase
MSELAGNVAATAARVAGGVASKGLFSALLGAAPWLPVAIMAVGLVGTLAGAGTAVWYRMQWKDCQAAQVEAINQQRILDRQDNMIAVSRLTGQLNANERAYDKAVAQLATIPRNTVCTNDDRVRAARELLCSKYPASEACSRPVAPR